MAKDKRSTISVLGSPISIFSHQDEDFISLTDMSKKFGDDALIYSWMRNRNTVEFLGIWERMHNPDFKGGEFETFKKEAGLLQGERLTRLNQIAIRQIQLLTAQGSFKSLSGASKDENE